MAGPTSDASDADSMRRRIRELEAQADRAEEVEQELASAERENSRIAEIHQSLLPDDPPEIAGLSLATSHRAPNKAGGDYYDFIPFQRDAAMEADPAGKWLLVVADASGHGPAAAMIMAMLQAVLHAYRGDDHEPGDVLAYVNQQMAQKQIEGSFVTAFMATIDPAARRLSYSSAGHHPPLVREPDGRVHFLDCEAGGPPLAVDPESEFGTHHWDFVADQMLLLYTDGVVEPRSPDGQEFGLERLQQVFSATGVDAGPRKALAEVNQAIRLHLNGQSQDDDKTLVAVRFEATG